MDFMNTSAINPPESVMPLDVWNEIRQTYNPISVTSSSILNWQHQLTLSCIPTEIAGKLAQLRITIVNANQYNCNPEYFMQRTYARTITVWCISRGQTDTFKNLERFKHMEAGPLSMQLQDDRFHKIRVFNLGDKIVVFTNKLTSLFFRKLIALWPVLAETTQLMTPELKEILRLFVQSDADAWYAAVQAMFPLEKIRRDTKQREILAIVSHLFQSKKAIIERHIQELQQHIRSYEQTIQQEWDALMAKQKDLLYFEQNTEIDSIQEIIEYIALHKTTDKVMLHARDAESLRINIKAPLVYYDEEVIKTFARKDTCSLWTPEVPWIKQLFIDCLIEQKYTLYFETVVVLNMETGAVSPATVQQAASLRNHTLSVGFPHPHIMFYACWGSNSSKVQSLWKKGNYLSAYEQIIAAVQGINLLDSAVMSSFRNTLAEKVYDNTPCLKDNTTGAFLTINKYREVIRNETNQTQSGT